MYNLLRIRNKRLITLALIVAFMGTVPACAQKPLTKPEKPVQTPPAEKSSSGTKNKSSDKYANGYINGHEYVDLGLSVKWATCNVGASSPSDYGNYYAWGETRTKSEYNVENCLTYGKDIESIAGDPKYDVARAKWGSTWRLPTKSEIEELVNGCKWEWTKQKGHNGYKVTSRNGNSIFLPAAAWRYRTYLSLIGEYGGFWSATPYENDTGCAYNLYFYCEDFSRKWYSRDLGQSVRPVSE